MEVITRDDLMQEAEDWYEFLFKEQKRLISERRMLEKAETEREITGRNERISGLNGIIETIREQVEGIKDLLRMKVVVIEIEEELKDMLLTEKERKEALEE